MAIYTSKTNTGFTIVELIVVVTVIAILAGITIIGYGAWQQNIAKDQMKSDLGALKSSMESGRNFGNTYPSAIPADFEASKGVTTTYKTGDGTSYCIEAQSNKTGSLKYYLNSADSTTPKEGSCPAVVIAAPNLNTATVTGTQVQLTWSTVSGASSYGIQYRRDGGAWVSTTSTVSNKTITGLVVSSTYDFQVRTVGPSSTSVWSGTLSRKTLPTPVITAGTDLGCGNSGGYYAWLNASVTWTAAPTTYTSSYRLEGSGAGVTVANPTGSGSLSGTGATTQWPANVDGSGTIYVFGIGPNGEKSSAGSWTSASRPPYDC